MSLFDIILQLSIISALGLMIQSAPINTMINKRSTPNCTGKDLTIPEERLFGAARDLHDATGKLHKAQYNHARLGFPEIDFDVENETVDELYSLFSYLCKKYANVMILKHQLQDYIFNSNMTDLNLTAEDIAGNISIILTSLQTMADSFDDFEFSIFNKRCVKLTQAQYQIMYYVKRNQDASLLKLKEDFDGWYKDFEKRREQLKLCIAK